MQESKPWAIQLLSVACLSIAAKMEEQRVPPLSEYPIEFRFENKVIKNMEILILTTLEWKMGLPTPFAFLHYFFTKFCNDYSRSETMISKATQHILTLVKGKLFSKKIIVSVFFFKISFIKKLNIFVCLQILI